MAQVSPSKAEQMLGIDKVSPLSTVTVQIQGNLSIRENSGKKKNRFCVVKDGFFIWYDKPPADSKKNKLSFDKKPTGLFPLNGAFVKMEAEDEVQIHLRHFEIPKSELTLYPDQFAANDWFSKLQDGTRATWEQAKLGVADLELMKAKGTKLEEEKKEAARVLEEQIREHDKATRKKNDLIEKDRKANEKFKNNLEQAQESLEQRNNQLQELNEKYKKEETEMKRLNLKNQQLESKLQMAHIALKRLDNDLQDYFGHDLSRRKRDSDEGDLEGQHVSNGSNIKDSAAEALNVAMVQSSPQVRLRKVPPAGVISDMQLPRLAKPKGRKKKAPALPRLPSAELTKTQMKQSVPREVVVDSVRKIKQFIDMNRSQNFSPDTDV